jgi:hypothetical protein
MALLRGGADNPRAEHSFGATARFQRGMLSEFSIMSREGGISVVSRMQTYVRVFLTSNRENRENRTETAPEIDTQNVDGHRSIARNGPDPTSLPGETQ